jgi:hypothetical protein
MLVSQLLLGFNARGTRPPEFRLVQPSPASSFWPMAVAKQLVHSALHIREALHVRTAVTNALIKNARKLPQELYKSLTWDSGKDMAAHKRFTLATDITVYFCNPHQPWQRRMRIRTAY